MIRIQDLGEFAYGGAVTLAEWWDNKRITEGKITSKDVFKKAGFYTYLGVGLVATLMSVFGWMRRYETWTEKISTGFIYDVPRFAYNLYKTVGTESSGRQTAESRAIAEANKILARAKAAKQITEGRNTERSYQPEFNKTMAW